MIGCEVKAIIPYLVNHFTFYNFYNYTGLCKKSKNSAYREKFRFVRNFDILYGILRCKKPSSFQLLRLSLFRRNMSIIFFF